MKLNSIDVKTRGGSQITASDTTTDPIASDSLYDFERKSTMHIRGEALMLVPFKSVDVVEIASTSESVTRPNPYGCEASDPNGLTTENGTEITDENNNPIIGG